jgi:uncharacterized membrane protein
MLPLFLGAFLSDLAYSASYEIQWKNFASWLLLGALVLAGFALLWALIDLLRGGRLVYFLLLLATWIVGFLDSLVHAKDAWASMPDALILSAVATLLAIAATAFGFVSWRKGDVG